MEKEMSTITRQQAEIEKYKRVIEILEKDVATAKSEAVKEFAERLKAINDRDSSFSLSSRPKSRSSFLCRIKQWYRERYHNNGQSPLLSQKRWITCDTIEFPEKRSNGTNKSRNPHKQRIFSGTYKIPLIKEFLLKTA